MLYLDKTKIRNVLIIIFLITIFGCSEKKALKHSFAKCSSAYLFNARQCSRINIRTDLREVINLVKAENSENKIQQSVWITPQIGDYLSFALGLTNKKTSLIGDGFKEKELRQVKHARHRIPVLISSHQKDEGYKLDQSPISYNIYVEFEDGKKNNFFSRKYNSSSEEKKIFPCWIEVNKSLTPFSGKKIRFHFTTRTRHNSQNLAFFTNPILVQQTKLRTLEKEKLTIKKERKKTYSSVLLISLDTLRADHLSCYGYPRHISPELDKISKIAWFYRRVITAAPWTLPSHLSVFTGLEPHVHRVDETEEPPLSKKWKTLTQYFRAANFRTIAFTEGALMSPGWGIDRGFSRFQYEGMLDKHVKNLLFWYKNQAENFPFFSFLHTYEIHSPYNKRHPRFVFSKHLNNLPPLLKLTNLSTSQLKRLVNAYDDGIRYADSVMGVLFQGMKQQKLFNKTEIIIFADHGEEFMEHGFVGHGTQLFSETLHVPLIIKKTNSKKFKLVNQQVPLISIPKLLNKDFSRKNASRNQQLFAFKNFENLQTNLKTRKEEILSETRRGGLKQRISYNNRAVLVSKASKTSSNLDVVQYDLTEDADEKKPFAAPKVLNLEIAKKWALQFHGTQLWFNFKKSVKLTGEIELTPYNQPKIIFPNKTIFLRFEASKIKFTSSAFSGVFGLFFGSLKEYVSVKFLVDGKPVYPYSIQKIYGQTIVKKGVNFHFPFKPYCSLKEIIFKPLPIKSDRISFFSLPEDPDRWQISEKPSLKTFEQLKALGYIN